MKRFKGKSVLVTGAGGGIGRGISLRLAEEGADIAACDIKEEELKETLKKIEETGQKGLALVCDVAKEDEIERTTQRVIESFGKID
ncbi:MAG: SDR family NAD(P)-dependent oxidoreductase, partial [Thermodesulfobacteriota bacterium]|nr:SDR family NAD(P)-dependent oxidoreductase [Thermodesulfobacteriota bacterium]